MLINWLTGANKQLIGADCAAENAMIKQLTGTDQSIGRCSSTG